VKKKKESDSEIASKINNALLAANSPRGASRKEKAIDLIKKYSIDYSNPIAPKTSPKEFLTKDLRYASLQPASILSDYYGKNLENEVISAGAYNAKNPVIEPKSFPRIFDYIWSRKSPSEWSSYHVPNEYANRKPFVVLESNMETSAYSANLMKQWLESNDSEKKQVAFDYFNRNSYDPSLIDLSKGGALEHEVGHHITQIDKNSAIAKKAFESAKVASNGFKKFGKHTSDPDETTQALSKFQRDWFKEKNSRITNPIDFMSIVNSGEIPKFLSGEGRRILIYTKNLKEVRDSDESEGKRKAAAEALKAISEMIPAVVQNKKKYGLNLSVA
jgi:hypothetical protein